MVDDSDDEATPAQTPRSKKSSITIKTAEVLAARIAVMLNVHLTDEVQEKIGELLGDWAAQQVSRVLKLEREEYARQAQELTKERKERAAERTILQEQLAEAQRERNRLASLLPRLP